MAPRSVGASFLGDVGGIVTSIVCKGDESRVELNCEEDSGIRDYCEN